MSGFVEWLRGHDLTIDLITVWALCIGFGVFGVVKAVSWWTLRVQRDATMVGVSLKRQKLGETMLGLGMSTLYGLTLYDYYAGPGADFGFWHRLVLRAGLFVVIALVSWRGVQFVFYLRREQRRL